MMEAVASVCGVYDCRSCEHRIADRCPGCEKGNLASRSEGTETCRVWECVRGREIASCEECTQPECTLKRVAGLICPLRSRLEKERWWAGRLSRALQSRGSRDSARQDPSEKVISRVRWYLTALDAFAVEGRQSVSSWQLAEKVGVSPALIRKDLSKFGEFGTPSYGYRIDFLRERLRSILSLGTQRELVWIGACALKLSTHAQDRLRGHNCVLRAVFDDEESEVGSKVGELVIKPISRIREELTGSDISAAVLAVHGPRAQDIALVLAEIGVRAILNLSGELLVTPPSVRVTNVDLIGELLELCYYCSGNS